VLVHRDIVPWLYELKLSGEKRDLANIRPVVRMIEEIEVGNRLLIDAASIRGRKRRCKLTPLQSSEINFCGAAVPAYGYVSLLPQGYPNADYSEVVVQEVRISV
jgi:hypothetical protein